MTTGWNLDEAKQLIQLCALVNSNTVAPSGQKMPFQGIKIPSQYDVNSPPSGWTQKYTADSPTKYGDNYWEIYQNSNTPPDTAIVFRGTEDNTGSMAEDAALVMIPAQGSLELEVDSVKISIDYQFAEQTDAAVHVGFAYGVLSLLKAIFFDHTIDKRLDPEGGSTLYITGHSQGAALATLFRSLIAYNTKVKYLVSDHQTKHYTNWQDVAIKTYAFAQPKPGNQYYAYDFAGLPNNTDMAYRVYNTIDWVPQTPLSLEGIADVNTPNLLNALGEKYPKVKDLIDQLEHMKDQVVEGLSDLANEVVQKELKFDPGLKFAPTLNYASAGAPITVPWNNAVPTENPNNKTNDIDFMWHHHAVIYNYLIQHLDD